jgi:hypothetical protein
LFGGVKGISHGNVHVPLQHYGYFGIVGVGILKSKVPDQGKKVTKICCQVGIGTNGLCVEGKGPEVEEDTRSIIHKI